jgi:hypothetical protein
LIDRQVEWGAGNRALFALGVMKTPGFRPNLLFCVFLNSFDIRRFLLRPNSLKG